MSAILQSHANLPSLPRELERDILELTARLYPESRTRLTIVARRTQIWIEPIVYGIVILNRPRTALKFLRTLDSKHLDFFVDYVKPCTGIVNLACWIIPDSYSTAVLAPIISRLGLRRLSLNQKALPGLDQYQPRDCALAFRSITHLDIVNHWALWSTSGLAALPQLTHIAFRYWACGSVAVALRNILSGCTTLQVLVLLTHNLIMDAALELLDHESLDDPRVVVMSYSKDMQHGETLERGEPDLWAQAEEIVMAQRARLPTNPQLHASKSVKESIDVCHIVYLSSVCMLGLAFSHRSLDAAYLTNTANSSFGTTHSTAQLLFPGQNPTVLQAKHNSLS